MRGSVMYKALFLVSVLSVSLFAKHLHKERFYQKEFCKRVKGEMEYRLKDKTRVDCQTNTYSFEIDFGSKGFEGVGQALYYSMMTGKKAGLVLIQESKRDNRYIGRLKKLCKKYGIKLFIINKKLEIRLVK